MSVDAIAHYTLPASPYDLWVRGELADYLHLPDDGTRVEVVGGEIVVSPGPTLGHNRIVHDVTDGVVMARTSDPSYRWRCVHMTDLNLAHLGDGYIPDLIILDVKVLDEVSDAEAPHLYPEQAGLVLEVTSPSTARVDRAPSVGRQRKSKFTGYARARIPYYLLVERDPRNPHIALLSDPDHESGLYLTRQTWNFGGVIRLPEPFEIEIITTSWRPWPV